MYRIDKNSHGVTCATIPDVYSGITDPVSALLDIAKQKHCDDTDNTDILTNTESAFGTGYPISQRQTANCIPKIPVTGILVR